MQEVVLRVTNLNAFHEILIINESKQTLTVSLSIELDMGVADIILALNQSDL